MTIDIETTRETLAAAHRIAAHDQLNEGTWNHFSYMVDHERMLITPADMHWADIEPEDLALVGGDREGARDRGELFYVGYRIHYPLHSARPDARAVLHAHPPYATALTLLEDATLMGLSQNSAMFYGRTAVNDTYDEVGDLDEQGRRLAAAIGDKDVLFMRGHGVVVVAPTIERAYTDLYLLELACRSQILALSTGQPLRRHTPEEADELAVNAAVSDDEAARHFAAMRAHLDRRAGAAR